VKVILHLCERDRLAVEMRAAGSTYPDIAERLGITVSRVRQILERARRILAHCERMSASGGLAWDRRGIDSVGLSPRAQNVLHRLGVQTLGGVAAASDSEILTLDIVGSQTLHEIRRVAASEITHPRMLLK
jgi:DNA-directed RNA polymerase alpha subunit